MSHPGPHEPALGRRQLLSAAGAGVLAVTLSACGTSSSSAAKATATKSTAGGDRNDARVLTWKGARKRLEDGNVRFAAGKPAHPDLTVARRKKTSINGQKPFAAVLACADSRVPPEIVFDQGLGDLFVVRSAGEVIDDAILGTLQFGVSEFAIPLIVVLGHTKCGAVQATIDAIEKKSAPTGTDVDVLTAALTPAIKEAEDLGAKKTDLLALAVDSNVERVVASLTDSKVLSVAVASHKLKIVGATYDIATGDVTFA
jgi:carbonic anhydrase